MSDIQPAGEMAREGCLAGAGGADHDDPMVSGCDVPGCGLQADDRHTCISVPTIRCTPDMVCKSLEGERMASRFTELVIDCHHPRKLAAFWSAALGYEVIVENDNDVEI